MKNTLICLLFLCGCNAPVKSELTKKKEVKEVIGTQIVGKVVAITDGDTVTVLDAGKTQHKIRLAEIDTPEKKQAFGTKAKEALADKIFNKEIKILWHKKDRYNRIIGSVYISDRYINKEMIEEGWAWHYTQYSKSKELAIAQDHAKKNKLGLWHDLNPVPPWEFRKKKSK